MTGAAANFEYITDPDRFADLCASWRGLPALGLDTEFIRTRTFYPKAGLLQFGVATQCYLVDPLLIDDWAPFRRTLAGTWVIMHAAGEDLGLLHHLLGEVPAALFDTQLAAAFLGEGFSLSYRDLVRRFCAVDLPKSETRSNWLKRPLSSQQLRYAAEDVRYLPALQETLAGRLARDGKLAWFEDDCRRLAAGAGENENPRNWPLAYRQVGGHEMLGERGLLLLQRLCHWREREIRARDLPRNWLAGDRDLLGIASALENRAEIHAGDIANAAGVNPKFARRFSARLARMLNEPEQAPGPPPQPRPPLSLAPRQRETLKRCRAAIQREAGRIGVCPELLVNKRQLQQIIISHEKNGAIDWPTELRGWRQQVLAPALSTALREQGGEIQNTTP